MKRRQYGEDGEEMPKKRGFILRGISFTVSRVNRLFNSSPKMHFLRGSLTFALHRPSRLIPSLAVHPRNQISQGT